MPHVLPPPGIMSSPTLSTFGAPQHGHRAWLSQMASRAPIHSVSSSLSTSSIPVGTMPTSSSSAPVPPTSLPAPGWSQPPGWTAPAPAAPPISSTTVLSVLTPGWGQSTGWALPLPFNPHPYQHAQMGAPPVNVIVDAEGIKSASKKRKCVVFDLDPHLYVDSAKSASIEDIISAEMSLLESMLALGFPIHSLTKHIRFLSDKSRVYTSSSLVKYDLAVREKAELLGPSSFVYGDHEFVHAFLGIENLRPKGKPKEVTQNKSRSPRQKGICWRFNESRGCKKDPCNWKQECRDCSGSHSVTECKVKPEVKS